MDDPLDNVPVRFGSGVEAKICVMDGAVYLPEGRTVAVESREFDQLLRKNLPPDIAVDVMAQWHGVSRHASRLQWAVSLVCLLAAFSALYYFFPKTGFDELKEHGGMEIRDLSGPLPVNSPYRSAFDAACRAYSEGNNNAVCRILGPSVEEIIRTGDRKSDRILSLYFKAVRKNQKGGLGSGKAAGLLRKLISQDPDNPNWLEFDFDLNPRIRRVLDYEDVRRKILSPEGRIYLGRYPYDVDYALTQLAELKRTAGPPKYTQAEMVTKREFFDLCEVKLLLSGWLLKGYSVGKILPDNRDDPGVYEREKALRIALKHRDSAFRDFWKARLFIAETLCEHDGFGLNKLKLNDIYWNGAYRNSLDELKQEIRNCRERLNGGQQL